MKGGLLLIWKNVFVLTKNMKTQQQQVLNWLYLKKNPKKYEIYECKTCEQKTII